MAPYQHPALESLPGKRIQFPFHPSTLWKRLATKAHLQDYSQDKTFTHALRDLSPDLVIISQGDNVSSLPLMNACRNAGQRYVTVTQLVAEVHMLGIGPSNIDKLRDAYKGAVRNFFVSAANLKLNDLMLGITLGNTEVVFNPCKVRGNNRPAWPSTSNDLRVGLVGRIEFLHKGYDLLLELASMTQWRTSRVIFQVYGNGPHTSIMESIINERQLANVRMMGSVSDVLQVWSENHALLMPSRMEGMSLSLIEAMWCGRMPIVTAVGGATDLVKDGVNGFVAVSATVGSINEAMERAWANRENWQSMGEKASKFLAEQQPNDEVEYFCGKILELVPA
jgi:glycosyltransferase involved in cell wall biosynthesis